MELNRAKGSPPLYYQLKELLEEKILSGEYPPGFMLPSEQELEKQYSLSRITVRQALNELSMEGLILRKRGSGTIVQMGKLFDEQLVTIKSFTNEMKDRGMKPGTVSMNFTMEAASRDVAQRLGLRAGERVCKMERVRSGNNVPVVVIISYFAGKHEAALSGMHRDASVYEVLKENGTIISRASDRYTAGHVGSDLVKMLDITAGTPVLIRTRIAYDSNDEAVEFTRCYYNSDLYSYTVELTDVVPGKKGGPNNGTGL